MTPPRLCQMVVAHFAPHFVLCACYCQYSTPHFDDYHVDWWEGFTPLLSQILKEGKANFTKVIGFKIMSHAVNPEVTNTFPFFHLLHFFLPSPTLLLLYPNALWQCPKMCLLQNAWLNYSASMNFLSLLSLTVSLFNYSFLLLLPYHMKQAHFFNRICTWNFCWDHHSWQSTPK